MKKYFVNVICTLQSQGMGWGWGTAQYSETLQISVRLLFFSSGYLSSHACKWGPWLWKFHALPHCSVLLGIRADTGKQEHVSLRETCVASVRKTQMLLWQLIFSPQIHMRMHTGVWFLHVSSSVTIILNLLKLLSWTDFSVMPFVFSSLAESGYWELL